MWIWKGDYWNLGAGAEIGIYTATESDITQNVENNEVFYQIDTNNTLHVEMTVKYRYLGLLEDTLNVLEDDNWWVCSFTPELQMPQIRWLSVDLKVRFNNDYLMTPFYDRWRTYKGTEETDDDWDEVEMAPTPYKSRATGHTTHKCNSEHPTECSCSYTCFSKPCRYYSDNGYQLLMEDKHMTKIIISIVSVLLILFPFSSTLLGTYQQLTFPGVQEITNDIIDAVKSNDIVAIEEMLSKERKIWTTQRKKLPNFYRQWKAK